MDWKEFCTLLSGIMPKTPLGTVVGLTSEEDKEVLKHYTKGQRQIRDEWRANHNPMDRLTEEEKIKKAKEIQDILSQTFG